MDNKNIIYFIHKMFTYPSHMVPVASMVSEIAKNIIIIITVASMYFICSVIYLVQVAKWFKWFGNFMCVIEM